MKPVSDNPDLRAIKFKLFLTCWVIFSLHFATNIIREHYPAFSLVDHFSFKVDEYLGFNSDIFQHTDGHSYIVNNVTGSVIAAVPLFIFDPVLDMLERAGKSEVREQGASLDTEYRIDKPNRKKFFKLVKESGLHLRFGGVAVVTSVFLMAPLSAWFTLLIFQILLWRGINIRRSLWLAILFAFATPVLFRTAHLSHNLFLMITVFLSFYLLWKYPERRASTLLLSGFFGGLGLALDYSGVVPLLLLYGYVFWLEKESSSFSGAFRRSLFFILGALPPVLFLLYTQWAMFGNPFLPNQYWMPKVHYTDQGWRGFSLPAVDLFFLNLFSMDYGMFTFAPLLLAGFIPSRLLGKKELFFSKRERWFSAIFVATFMIFCAANQYSRMQFNTGFRYFMPLVPFIFLASSDYLARLPAKWLAIISVPTLLNSWVVTMFREPVDISWSMFLHQGIIFPWLQAIRLTSTKILPFVLDPIFPYILVLLTAVIVFLLWKIKPAGISSS